MVRGHDHPSKTDSYGFHPPFWLLKSCSILISGWQIDQVPQFFSSNPICLIIFGCNFPIFTGLFTFFGVNLCFFHQFWTFSSVTSAPHFTWPTTAMKAAGARTKACDRSDHFQSMTYGYD